MRRRPIFEDQIGQHTFREILVENIEELGENYNKAFYSPGYDIHFLHATISEMINKKVFSGNQEKMIILLLGYNNFPFCPDHHIGMRSQRKVSEILGKSFPNLNQTIKRIKRKIEKFLKPLDFDGTTDLYKLFPSYWECEYNSLSGICMIYNKKCSITYSKIQEKKWRKKWLQKMKKKQPENLLK